jgi:single-strand DNA-binding protein
MRSSIRHTPKGRYQGGNMADFNKVILIGNLTRDPELRATQSGLQICKFGIAINRRRGRTQDGQQREDETCYVDLTAFGRQAELINQYVSKGRPIFIEGRLEYSTWEKDGQKRSKLAVVVENFQFLNSGQGEGGQRGGGPSRGSYGGQQGGGGQAPAGDWESGGFGEGDGFGEASADGDIPF